MHKVHIRSPLKTIHPRPASFDYLHTSVALLTSPSRSSHFLPVQPTHVSMKRIPRGATPTRLLQFKSSPRHPPRIPLALSLQALHGACRPSRSFSIVPRQSGTVDLHRVSVRNRRFTWKKLVTTSLGVGLGLTSLTLVYGFLIYEDDEDEDLADFSLVANRAQEVSKGDPLNGAPEGAIGEAGDDVTRSAATADGEVEEEQEDEVPEEMPADAWFIPLGRLERKPRTFYRGSDPEWREFQAFNKDVTRRKRVQDKLVEDIQRALLHDPRMKALMGPRTQCKRTWLWVEYPLGPEPEWCQRGIEIAPDYIAILTRTRDPNVALRIQRAIWPDAVAMSAFGAFQTFLGNQYRSGKKALGFDLAEAKASNPLHFPVNTQASKSDSTAKADFASASNTGLGTTTPNSSGPPANRPLLSIIPSYPQDEGIVESIKVFKRNLARRRHRTPALPRGVVVIQGQIQFSGSATCILDVKAVYSVMDNKFHAVNAGIRTLQPHTLRPKG